LLIIIGSVVSPFSFSATLKYPTELDCKAFMIYKEARGETKIVQKAVLDVLENRMKQYKMTACEVIKQKGQYPYAKKGIQKVDKKYLTLIAELDKMSPVLTSDFLYFNTRKHKFKKRHKKIGNLYFC
jgi:esterase/lipase